MRAGGGKKFLPDRTPIFPTVGLPIGAFEGAEDIRRQIPVPGIQRAEP